MRKLLLLFPVILSAAVFGAAQTPTPSPVPEAIPVPTVAPGYENRDLSLPELGRVGVDLTNQKTLSMLDAIELALSGNLDIEVSRKTEEESEFDLKAAKGVYQPRLTGQTYYDRTTTPNTSVFSTNQKQTVGTLLGNAGVTAYIPRFGTVLGSQFNNNRFTTDNPISILSPQMNASLGFSVTQPLFRGRKFDVNRHNIEIAKRN